MSRRNHILLLLALLSVSSCSVDNCIAPGEGVSTRTSQVFIPVFRDKDPDKLSDWWTDSGIEVSSTETIPITVSGTINLCDSGLYGCGIDETSKRENPNCKSIQVPAVFCANGESPSYSSESYDPQVICAGKGGKFSRAGYYVDTGLKVNPGDQVEFSLIKRQLVVEKCPPDDTIFGNYLFGEVFDKNGLPISLQNICERDNELKPSKDAGQYSTHASQLKKSFSTYVDNSVTPRGNKLYFFANRPLPWISTALVDIRYFKEEGAHGEYDHSCSPVTTQLKRYNTYDVNYRCNNICSDLSKITPSCFVTFSKDWFGSGKDRQDVLFDPNNPGDAQISKQYADLLIAKIGDADRNYGAIGTHCLPTNQQGMCMNQTIGDSRMELNRAYLVHPSVAAQSPLMVGIRAPNSDYSNNVGGYYIEAEKRCTKTDGDGLYMYIGQSAPNIDPGDAGSFLVKTTTSKDKDGKTIKERFIINGGDDDTTTVENGNPKRDGKIFFAIKGARNSDTYKIAKSAKLNPNPDNGYKINITRGIWTPKVSEFFSSIRDSVLVIMYGPKYNLDGKDLYINQIPSAAEGLVQSMHKNIIEKGLGKFVQVILVLYVAASALAFMLGLVQYPKTELFMRSIKVMFVASMLEKSTWEMLTESLFGMFVKASDQLIGIIANQTDADGSFAFFDQTLGTLMANETWLRMASLLPAGILGWFIFVAMLWGIFIFVSAIFSAMLIYLLNIIGTALLLTLSPIFLTCMLFEKTKMLFQSWLKLLLAFAIRPVFIFSAIALLNQVMMRAFYEVNNFQVCTQCWLYFTMEVSKDKVDNVGLCLIRLLMPHGYIHDSSFAESVTDTVNQSGGMGFFGMPFHASILIVFLICAFAMRSFVDKSDDMSKAVSGTMFDVSMAAAAAGQALLSVVGLDRGTQSLIGSASEQSKAHPQKVEFRHKPKGTSEEAVYADNAKETQKEDGRAESATDRASTGSNQPRDTSVVDIPSRSNADSFVRMGEDQPGREEQGRPRSDTDNAQSQEGAQDRQQNAQEDSQRSGIQGPLPTGNNIPQSTTTTSPDLPEAPSPSHQEPGKSTDTDTALQQADSSARSISIQQQAPNEDSANLDPNREQAQTEDPKARSTTETSDTATTDRQTEEQSTSGPNNSNRNDNTGSDDGGASSSGVATTRRDDDN